MLFFSIIVPIYKVENYISECIESVLLQNFKNFELILVNDGSPDGCDKICDEYAQHDSRIKVIHKKNGGLSDARNAGLKIAKGEYISFLDGDDYMTEDSLEKIFEFIRSNERVDMLTCAHMNAYNDNTTENVWLPFSSSKKIINQTDYYSLLSESSGAYWSAWKNIFRREVMQENDLYFTTNLIGAEDCDFFIRFIECSNSFLFYNIPLVYYRLEREGSITNSLSMAALSGQLKVFYDNFLYFADKENMKTFFANKYANAISNLFALENKSDIALIIADIQTHKMILKNTKGKKYNFSKLMWEIFGYHKGSILIYKVRNKIENLQLFK